MDILVVKVSVVAVGLPFFIFLLSSMEKLYKAKEHPSYITFTILGLLLPIVGIIVGIIYIAKEDPLDRKIGEHAIAISVLGIILGAVVAFAFVGFEIIP